MATADPRCLERALGGDESAFATLVASWTPVLLRTATVVTGGAADEEDVVRRTWLRVVRDLPSVGSPGTFGTWVCHRLLAEARRVPAGRPPRQRSSPEGAAVSGLARVAAALPERQRLVLGLRDVAGCELADVQEASGLSRRDALRLLTLARETVRDQLRAGAAAAVTPAVVR
jgi:RNA polymerase sigma-70 factor (ECF subfamily)